MIYPLKTNPIHADIYIKDSSLAKVLSMIIIEHEIMCHNGHNFHSIYSHISLSLIIISLNKYNNKLLCDLLNYCCVYPVRYLSY